mgnify:CR=1 FL=1
MGLFGFGREKPRTPAQIVATVDLVRGMVCELGRDDDRAAIERRLGTPTKTEKTGLLYEQIGLHFNVEKTGPITGFSIFFTPSILPHWTWSNRRSVAPTEADVLALLGSPTKRETDEEEIMLAWDRAGFSILVDFALDGTLNDVMVDFV